LIFALGLSRWSFFERSRRPLRATQTFIVSPSANATNTASQGLPERGYSNIIGALQQELLQRTMFAHGIENASVFGLRR
jgi:hypothetical protein